MLSVLTLCIGSASCKKLEQGPRDLAHTKLGPEADLAQGRVGSEPDRFADAIAAEYGRLVAVNPISDKDRGWNTLWFEKPDQTIVVVTVNWIERKKLDDVVVISRK